MAARRRCRRTPCDSATAPSGSDPCSRDVVASPRLSPKPCTCVPIHAPRVPPMSLDWSPLVDIVRRHDRFLLTTHVRPDPDGLGSMLGLAARPRRHGQDRPARHLRRLAAALRLHGSRAPHRPRQPAGRRRVSRRPGRHRARHRHLEPARRLRHAPQVALLHEGRHRSPHLAGRSRRHALRRHHRRGDRPARLRDRRRARASR